MALKLFSFVKGFRLELNTSNILTRDFSVAGRSLTVEGEIGANPAKLRSAS